MKSKRDNQQLEEVITNLLEEGERNTDECKFKAL